MEGASATVTALKAGDVTHQAILSELEGRRRALDPQINAFIHCVDEPAALAADTPLAGLPISVKDQIHVAGMPCTFGLAEKRPMVPEKTATAVQRLVDAGATIIGKTSLPPLAMDFQTGNDLIGRTNNPWNLEYTSGGSSGGGAAAVASGMSLADIGADLAGSLRIPAAFCGVYSLLPSAGALPGDGMMKGNGIELRHFARIGPIARSVDDLELLWTHMSGEVRQEIEANRIRLAVCSGSNILPVEKRITDVFERAVATFGSNDVEIVRAVPQALICPDSWESYGTIMGHETGALMNRVERLLARQLGRAAAARSPRFLKPVHEGYRRCEKAYGRALDRQRAVAADLSAFLENHDALLLPVSCVGTFRHRKPTSVTGPVRDYAEPFDIDGNQLGYLDALTAFTTPVSLAGNPVVTMPLGLDGFGLPVGAQLVGKTGCERQLLALAGRLSSMLQQIAAPGASVKRCFGS
ncbi:amidase [Hoeflea sp. TYP-13]|uniref:amidase n=1 Tax=Hoeflea sp. TYP-13 TaxID=3230023 RepID=UPI0034C651D9